MNLSQTSHSVNCTIDLLLEKGASKLYDKYLNNKLPQHAHSQNNSTFYNNLSLNQVIQPKRTAINQTPINVVEQVPIDPMAPKHLVVQKDIDGYSTLSPKNTTFGKSTKYQTIIQSQKSSIEKQKDLRNVSDSMNFQQENESDLPITIKKGRPMTMQTARNKKNILMLDSKLQEVEQKRAMTCHTRKRKAVSVGKQEKFFKVDQEIPTYIRQQIELTNRLRKYKKDRQDQELSKAYQNAKIEAYIRLKEKRTRQNFQEMKSKLKGKSKETPAITNVQTDNGNIVINGKQKQQKTHIIQLQFNPQEQQISKTIEPKVSSVNGTKKNSFIAKLKKKTKITNQQFTNNGGRQVSSIPFMHLNYGIVLSESTIEATASRRRPSDQVSRQQFTITNQSQRFKSHNPLINSARLNAYVTIDDPANQTVKSSFFETTLTDRRQFDTTLDSRREMSGSILWRAREKSEHKKIRISNLEAFNQQIMQIKLAH